jgi:hypothetical protein
MAGLKIAFSILLALVATTLAAEPVHHGKAEVDWLNMKLTVSGTAVVTRQESGNMISWQLEAAKRAEQDLLRNFIDAMRIIRIDAFHNAHDILLKDLHKNELIYRYFYELKEASIEYGEDRVSIEKVFPLFGETGFCSILYTAGKDTGYFNTYDEYVFSTAFSGLVIDARGLERKPSIAPRIFDEGHNLVFAADFMERESYAYWGAVQFTTDPHYTDHAERVGNNPYRIMAIPDERLTENDFAIFTDDARVLLQNSGTRSNLLEGRVVIIVDSL